MLESLVAMSGEGRGETRTREESVGYEQSSGPYPAITHLDGGA